MSQETFHNCYLKLTTKAFAATTEDTHAFATGCIAWRAVMRDGIVNFDNSFATGAATTDVALKDGEATDYESPKDSSGGVRTLYIKPAQASGQLEIWERVAINV